MAEIVPDEGLEFIDRMSHKYTGRDYEIRAPRENFVITIDRIASSTGTWYPRACDLGSVAARVVGGAPHGSRRPVARREA